MIKKLQILLAIVLSALAISCTKETTGADSRIPISFSASTGTKTLVTSLSDLQTNGITVYGTRKVTSYETLFNGVALSYTTAWGYSPVQYWEPTADYYFAGVYPSGAFTFTPDGETSKISAANVTTGYTYGSQNDLMFGSCSRTFSTSADGAVVELPMKHVLSALVFKVRNGSSDGVATVSAASVTGILSTGSLVAPLASGEVSRSNWTVNSTPTMTCTGDGTDLTDIAVSTTAHDLFQEPILVIPQAVTAEMALSFTVTQSGGSTTQTKKLNSATGITAWEPGKKYTYIATITDSVITFAITVNDWEEDEEVELK